MLCVYKRVGSLWFDTNYRVKFEAAGLIRSDTVECNGWRRECFIEVVQALRSKQGRHKWAESQYM